MTDVVVRSIPFNFDSSVPFHWQPKNPYFGVLCNSFTFFAVPFERYIVAVVRDLRKKIDDPEVLAEADAFLKQEAQHSSAHRKHMLALIEQYPGLAKVYDGAIAMFEELRSRETLDYHLAYIANVEATFTPLMKVFLDNRESLFAGGDQRVASLMMWHFVEEIEHRSSALILSRYVTPSRWYRVKHAKEMFAHVNDLMMLVVKGFDEHVPLADRKVSAVEALTSGMFGGELKRRLPIPKSVRGKAQDVAGVPSIFHAVPTTTIVKMMWRLALSQAPAHDPADQPLPQWADEWMRAYDRGADMTAYFGTPPATGASHPASVTN